MPKNYVARQPVFDINLDTWGYELLFRSSVENLYVGERDDESMDRATMSVIEGSLVDHICTLGLGARSLINFTRNLLVGEFAYLLPKDGVVIEILEDVYPDDEVVDACKKLKEDGYILALDDFVYSDCYRELLVYVDIVKIDFMSADKSTRRDIIKQLESFEIVFLAEKVENYEDFEDAKEIGCKYFQGYFFSKPRMTKKHAVYESKFSKLRLMSEINSSEFDVGIIEEIFKSDPVLTLRLFKFINSSYFSFGSEITNLRQAIMLLGERNLKKGVTVLATADLCDNKPFELVRDSIMRAVFCESIAKLLVNKVDSNDYFLLGLLSHIEAFFDKNKHSLLRDLPILPEIKGVLLDEIIEGGLYASISIARSLEHGLWSEVDNLAKSCRIDAKSIEDAYYNSAIETQKVVEVFHY